MAVKAIANVTLTNISDGTDGKMLYGVCTDSGATRTVTVDGVTSYYTGLAIAVRFTVASVSSMTLNVNSLGAKTVYFNNTNTGGYCPAGYMVILVYETSTSSGGCWKAAYSFGSDTFDRTRYNGAVKASSAVTAGNLIVGNSSGYFHLKTGAAFDITYPILYAASSMSSGTAGTNNYTEITFTITTTQSITLTAYKTVYIKGTLLGNIFAPISTTPLTQEEPTTEDGYYYILLGFAFGSTSVRLHSEHKVYKYFGGSFQAWNGANDTAEDAAKTATNYLNYNSTDGLLIGNRTSGEWSGSRAQVLPKYFNILDSSGDVLASYGETSTIGKASGFNTYIDTDSVDIRNGTTVLASFGSTTTIKNLIASNATISGKITATSGTVGGWSVNSNAIYSIYDGKYTVLKNNGVVALATGAPSVSDTTGASVQICHDGRIISNGDTYSTLINGGVITTQSQSESYCKINGDIWMSTSSSGATKISITGEGCIQGEIITATSDVTSKDITASSSITGESLVTTSTLYGNSYCALQKVLSSSTSTALWLIGNNEAITRIASKTVGSSSTGYSFAIANGVSFFKTAEERDQFITSDCYLAGGQDSTGKYLKSGVVYSRTYSTAANVVITSEGTFGRYKSSSARYKHDIVALTNLDNATQEGIDRADVLSGDVYPGYEEDMLALLKLPVSIFKYNEGYFGGESGYDYGAYDFGFIAEDVAAICPACAQYEDETVYDTDENGARVTDEEGTPIPSGERKTSTVEGWDEKAMVPRIVYILQYQQKRIDELEAMLNKASA